MANLEILNKSHNQKIMNNLIQNRFNCAGGCKYNLKGGNCHSENIIYNATVKSDLEKKFSTVYAKLSSGFGMLTTKNILKVVYTKMKQSFQSMMRLKAHDHWF